jgi:predicted transcriptional regulator
MTESQKQILEFYKDFYKTNKTHPSPTFVGKHFGITRQAITQQILSLVNKGYLKKVYDGAFIPTSKKY